MVGNAEIEEYNGQNLASEKCAVVVTLNYRLGPLGFLYIEEHTGGGSGGKSMNHNKHLFSSNKAKIHHKMYKKSRSL